MDGQTNVVHWLAQLDNVGGSYKEQDGEAFYLLEVIALM